MKYLTEKELAFLNALKKEQEINKEKSFMEVLFQASFIEPKKMKKDLDDLFQGYYENLFTNSDLIFESVNSCYVGKYKETFWGTGSEGEIFGLGQEIQNIVFPIIFSELGQVTDPEEKISVCQYFKDSLGLDYDKFIQSYRDFCSSFGYQYKEDLEFIQKQSETFEGELESLK